MKMTTLLTRGGARTGTGTDDTARVADEDEGFFFDAGERRLCAPLDIGTCICNMHFGSGTPDFESGIPHLKSYGWKSKFGIWNLESEIWNLKFGSWNLKFGIGIWSLESGIRNLNVAWSLEFEICK